MRARAALALLAPLAAGLVGSRCGGGDGSGGGVARIEVTSPDSRCAALASQFPPGFDFVPGLPGRALVADFAPPQLLPFDVESVPPEIAATPPVLRVPADSDGDGRSEGSGGLPLAPVLDGVVALAPDLALVTATGYEEVLFFAPDAGALRSVEVRVPASSPPGDHPFLPPPGGARLQTGISTFACVRPPPGALDSRGEPIASSLAPAAFCDPAVPSYLASFTSGAAVVGDHLFVSMSNLGSDAGSPEPQYLPGAVLVYDLDLAADPPVVAPSEVAPVIFPTAFNPTHVTRYATGGREFALVTASGAVGIAADDPGTPEIESAGIALGDAAIDVIDAQTLELVATWPLGRAGLSFDRLAIDPGGAVAVTGSAVDRTVYAVDLAPLATLPGSVGAPVVLDPLFDAAAPFRIPGLAAGAPPASCPGFTVSAAFNDRGDRLFVSDFCDGTIATLGFDAARREFEILELTPFFAPLRAETLGRPRAPGALRVRPGAPGVDFAGPDVFVLVSQPVGLLCGLRLES